MSRPASHHPSHASLSGRLRGLSCVAGHVCSWRWRPCYANPPLRLRKVPFLPAQKENNKEPSVAAACGVQRSHQNGSKSHSVTLPLIHLSVHDSLSIPDPHFSPKKDKPLQYRIKAFQVFKETNLGCIQLRKNIISCCYRDKCEYQSSRISWYC